MIIDSGKEYKSLLELAGRSMRWFDYPTDSVEQGNYWHTDKYRTPFDYHFRKSEWNPIEDDAQAFRLGAYHCIEYVFGYNPDNTVQRVIVDDQIHVLLEDHEGDLCAAIRMAIVLAAARIGKEMAFDKRN